MALTIVREQKNSKLLAKQFTSTPAKSKSLTAVNALTCPTDPLRLYSAPDSVFHTCSRHQHVKSSSHLELTKAKNKGQPQNWNKKFISLKLTFTTFGMPTKTHGPSLQTDPTSPPRLITLAHLPVWQSHSRTVPSLLPEQSLLHLRGSAIPLTACYQKNS